MIETLDAPSDGVDYTLLFGLIDSIVRPASGDSSPQHSTVILHSGEEVRLEAAGDLREGNGGMLIFAGESGQPEYVDWSEIAQIQFDRPSAMYPPVPAAPLPPT